MTRTSHNSCLEGVLGSLISDLVLNREGSAKRFFVRLALSVCNLRHRVGSSDAPDKINQSGVFQSHE